MLKNIYLEYISYLTLKFNSFISLLSIKKEIKKEKEKDKKKEKKRILY